MKTTPKIVIAVVLSIGIALLVPLINENGFGFSTFALLVASCIFIMPMLITRNALALKHKIAFTIAMFVIGLILLLLIYGVDVKLVVYIFVWIIVTVVNFGQVLYKNKQ
ncbi:hypothetical protein LJC60_11285 [Ruminococcaceae bacterium OttesenSCG-928-D13]|nr:hypothetical protein [Ruminococcaceae bacterium OttesenSCG-928-D13]